MSLIGETQNTIPEFGLVNPQFEGLVTRVISSIDKETLSQLRKEFHTRLRLTLNQPDNPEIVEDLWDFFYDWSLFEEKLSHTFSLLTETENKTWQHVKHSNIRSLFQVYREYDAGLKLKDLYTSQIYWVPKSKKNDFLGLIKTDILEGRLMMKENDAKNGYSFVRKPSFHSYEIHSYIKQKVKEFKRSGDQVSYQNWLWLLVGMYLKTRIYSQMPIEKIYDDNSRI